MGDLSTSVRAFFTKRIEPTTLISYSLLIAMALVVVAGATMIVVGQIRGL